MSLLTKQKRSTYLKALGYSGYSTANVLAFQKKAFADPKEHDGRYGTKTDLALRHFYNVKKNCKDFKAEEFRCKCGRCTGYPTQMRAKELKHIQTIRTHYGKPMIITSALRCDYQNRSVGGVSNSAHKFGRAVDFYMVGVTDTKEHRKKSIAYIKTLKNHKYTYGDGIDSYGEFVYKPSMGNALHTEVKP